MTQVKLLGELGDKFGSEWTSNSKSMRDIFKLIDCQVEGFKEYLQDCHEKNIGFTIQNGDDFIDYDDLALCHVKDTVIISAVPAGSGKGLGKILAALAVLVLFIVRPDLAIKAYEASQGGFFEALAAGAQMKQSALILASIGANLAIAGITEMTAPDAGNMTSDPSFLFNGANNTIEQGQPVPLLYGEMRVGGLPISQQFSSGRLKNNQGYVYLSGDTDYIATRYVGNDGGGTIGGNPGGPGGNGDIDGSQVPSIED